MLVEIKCEFRVPADRMQQLHFSSPIIFVNYILRVTIPGSLCVYAEPLGHFVYVSGRDTRTGPHQLLIQRVQFKLQFPIQFQFNVNATLKRINQRGSSR